MSDREKEIESHITQSKILIEFIVDAFNEMPCSLLAKHAALGDVWIKTCFHLNYPPEFMKTLLQEVLLEYKCKWDENNRSLS